MRSFNRMNKIIEIASTFSYPVEDRVRALRELSKYPYQEVIAAAVKCSIVDDSFDVRRAAVETLRRIDPKAAFDKYLKNLGHKSPEVLERAIHALGQLAYSPQQTVVELLNFVDHPDERVRGAAKKIVAKLAGSRLSAESPRHRGRTPHLQVVGHPSAYI